MRERLRLTLQVHWPPTSSLPTMCPGVGDAPLALVGFNQQEAPLGAQRAGEGTGQRTILGLLPVLLTWWLMNHCTASLLGSGHCSLALPLLTSQRLPAAPALVGVFASCPHLCKQSL